nr:MAG TPA: hypothetical protein [Caudoviricetes sp.]
MYCSSEWEMGGCFSIGYTLYTNTKVHDIVWSLQKCRAVSKRRVECNELYRTKRQVVSKAH